MSYKIDIDKMMAYLYGELSIEEVKEMEALIEKHPELKRELDELGELRGIMGELPDKEVIEPVIFQEQKREVPYLKTILAVAASISLIVLLGYLTNLKISFSENQLLVQFGRPEIETTTINKNKASNSDLIQSSPVRDNSILQRQIDSLKVKLEEYNTSRSMISAEINKSLNQNLNKTKIQLAAYAREQQQLNADALVTLLAQSEDYQKQYINALLTDYSEYLDTRREEDMQFYIDGLQTLKEDYDLKQIETEQLLTNLITTNGQTLPGGYRAGSK
ncbi:MAG: hypothetical protein AAFN93_08290 [Bacteroidota bacterium]